MQRLLYFRLGGSRCLGLGREVAIKRAQASHSLATLAVKHTKLGAVSEAYTLEEIQPVEAVGATEVALKFLAAPINPADVNVAQGNYGMSKELPSIAGIEGVAVVEKVGSSVRNLQVDDWVLPHKALLGTWTQSTKADQSSVVKISKDIPLPYAATLGVNPCTAYRMLRDFVDLKAGDVIMQNGANSMVGYAVIQMAREMGVKTINIVRTERPDTDIVTRLLSNLGGDVNITDDYVNTRGFKEIADEFGPIKLALDCVGGETVTHMSRALAPGATIVTYGAMSKKPLTVPFDVVSSKMLKMRGFWISKWMEENSIEDRSKMLNEISQMIREQKLRFFFEMHDLDDFQHAVEKSQEPYQFRKVVLNVNFPDRMKEHDSKDEREYDQFDVLYDPAV